jgi:hypothetical protein
MKKILSLQKLAAAKDDCLIDSTSSVRCPTTTSDLCN